MKELLKESFEEDGYHKRPKEGVVLKATKLFTYDSIKNKKMFHARVATETEFFRVMVFEENLEKKFTPGNSIVFSDYFSIYGSLMIHQYSTVSEVNSQNKEISNSSDERRLQQLKICLIFTCKQKKCPWMESLMYTGSSHLKTEDQLCNPISFMGIFIESLCTMVATENGKERHAPFPVLLKIDNLDIAEKLPGS
ncbi:Interferon-activable protein 202 [Apodemus speciosus]|uniref:Interferon-activable protein 202 n=1 Tax=Apodemus speciosus TaxID=105296 RepID=A0ABQ0EFY7_APOSI